MPMPSEAFLILCMQNDLCHPEGVYAKNGLIPTSIPAILPQIKQAGDFCRKRRIPIIACMLSIITDLDGNPCSLGSVKKLRPFLEKEGFRQGTWGHSLLEEIPKAHYQVRQWGMSPFYQTELERLITALNVRTLVLSGFTTNGVVESCARESASRHFRVVTLSDCVASYSESLHEASLLNLSAFGHTCSTQEWIAQKEKSLIQ